MQCMIEFLQTRTKNCDLAVAASLRLPRRSSRVFEPSSWCAERRWHHAVSVENKREQTCAGSTLTRRASAAISKTAKDHEICLGGDRIQVPCQENGMMWSANLPVTRAVSHCIATNSRSASSGAQRWTGHPLKLYKLQVVHGCPERRAVFSTDPPV